MPATPPGPPRGSRRHGAALALGAWISAFPVALPLLGGATAAAASPAPPAAPSAPAKPAAPAKPTAPAATKTAAPATPSAPSAPAQPAAPAAPAKPSSPTAATKPAAPVAPAKPAAPAQPAAPSSSATPSTPAKPPAAKSAAVPATPAATPATAAATSTERRLEPQQQRARDIFRELIEIDTTQSAGDTYRAARSMAARLRAAGFPTADVHVYQTAPKRGNLVVRLRGSAKKKPLLLLAHLDVVEAKPEDWSTPPFTLVEKDGYFYARGSGDDKYMAASFVANFVRYRQERYQPERDLILALTSDEEISDRYHYGINSLLEKHRELIDAEFALNEGGSVGVKEGKVIWNSIQTSEKLYQSFWLEVTNSGGHSSQPRKDNAIYTLARGLARLEAFDFPLQLDATTRSYFERMAKVEQGQVRADIQALLSPKPDPKAVERLSAKAPFNAQLRTTCVATRLEGGHADNALPQLARALLNCRLLPGTSVDEVQATLVRVLGDAQIQLKPEARDTGSLPSALEPELVTTIERLSAEFWPGVPLLPTMSAGATDGRFLRNAGIPTYGHSGLANDILDVRSHGKDERIRVDAFFKGQEYLYRLVKALAGGKSNPPAK